MIGFATDILYPSSNTIGDLMQNGVHWQVSGLSSLC